MTCRDPIGLDALAAYWLGELPEAQQAPLEEHLFACAHCSRQLEHLAAVAAGVRAAVDAGTVSMVVTPTFVEAMKRSGMRLREYRVDPGGSVNCTIRAEDDAVISRLQVPLAGVKRVDLVRRRTGAPDQRLADVAFDPTSGEVLMIPSTAWLKTMADFTLRVQLVSVSDAGETPLGEYTFNHAPS